jgi:hypothetical protein
VPAREIQYKARKNVGLTEAGQWYIPFTGNTPNASGGIAILMLRENLENLRRKMVAQKKELFDALQVEGQLFDEWQRSNDDAGAFRRWREQRTKVSKLRSAFQQTVADFVFAKKTSKGGGM